MDPEKRTLLLDAHGIQTVLIRMAREIIQNHGNLEPLVLIGVHTRGVHLARRLADTIAEINGRAIPTGDIDITLYRDDWTKISYSPVVQSTDIGFPIDDKIVVLVDDVLFTGRTTRAALDALTDFGRPAKVALAVLIDREGMRELPIQADYVGMFVKTVKPELVNVLLSECDDEDAVVIIKE
jgi:pyrimidine operon attenuation protein/uracil phosphoribosyltransferase